MLSLIYFILIAAGMTWILVYGSIFNRIRPNKKFFKCPACIGFWVGLFLVLTNQTHTLFNYSIDLFTMFFMGCLSSFTSYVLCRVFSDEGIRINFLKEK